jgi:hypothetical protein
MTTNNKLLLTCIMLIIGLPVLAMAPQEQEIENQGKELFHAVFHKNSDRIQMLIEQKADANWQNSFGDTALILAATQGDLNIVKKLLEAKANVNFMSHHGNTALIETVRHTVNVIHYTKYLEVIRVLLEAGAKIDLTTPYHWTALSRAAEGNLETTQLLLQSLTTCTTQEKCSFKNWLLVNQRLRYGLIKDGQIIEQPRLYLPKDAQNIVTQKIYALLPTAQNLRECVIHAGGLRALRVVPTAIRGSHDDHETVRILNQYMDVGFLEGIIRNQILFPKSLNLEIPKEENENE